MHLKRDYLIKKQLEINRQKCPNFRTDLNIMNKLSNNALQQLSLNRVKSKQTQYHQIQLFLLAASHHEAVAFYQKLQTSLQQIFNDEKSKKIFQQKWSHSLKRNVVGLFNRIARDFFKKQDISMIFSKLYSETIKRLLNQDKVSRIEQKFIDSLLMIILKNGQNLNILGNHNISQIQKCAQKTRKRILDKQTPKSLSNCLFLQYSVLSILKMQLPHEKYLYNQLLHAPNPKFLLPFQKKGTFAALGSEMLHKLNKVDMQGFLYWNYLQCEQKQKQSYQLYNKIRRAAGWQAKIDIMLLIMKSKVKIGIEKYMNLINQKIKFYSNRNIDQKGINDITSYIQICLQICYKKSDPQIQYALQKVDIGQAFQQKNFEQQVRLKDTMLKLVELYFYLIIYCAKVKLKIRFIRKIVIIICKLLKNYNDDKFTCEITNLVLKLGDELSENERTQLLFNAIENVNREWQKQQQLSQHEIMKINPQILILIADFSYKYGFEDENRPDYKVLKLQLFFILALNYKEIRYFQGKKKLSLARLDLNHSLSNNYIFNILDRKNSFDENFKNHLKTIFGQYNLKKTEHEGLLAVIDEIVTFRIQMIKQQTNLQPIGSFYAFLVDFLEQVQRIDPSENLLLCVKNYFQKCIKTYQIETARLKFQDSGKKMSVKLLSIDVSFLCQASIAANPLISKFCQKVLNQYIYKYPQLAFDVRILTVLAECTSLLYRKSTQQYQSKAQRIKGKYLVSNTLIPTRAKDVTKRLIFIMTAFYRTILHAHCINDNYLRIRCLYLVKQNSKTANITFGWKYLKHIISNFREDNSFVRNQVLMNNSCAWFINEQFYNRKIKQMKPDKILLDKCLLPIHQMKCQTSDLKKIFQSVQPQLQIQFLIIPSQQTSKQIDEILFKVQKTCENVENLYLQGYPDNIEEIEQQQNKLYDIISRIKTIYIQQNNSLHIFSTLLEICRKFNNHELFKYVLLKILPLLYCMTDLSNRILAFASESLGNIVREFNSVGKLSFPKNNPQSTQDTFNIKADYFDSTLQEYQVAQNSAFFKDFASKKFNFKNYSKRYMIMKLHARRMFSLQKMYKYFIKFLSEHLHVLVAKGIPLLQIAQIFRISFNLDLNILQFLPLQSICYCLNSHLQLVNLLKASIQKGQNAYDQSYVDQFYYKSLKMGLFHFQKHQTFYKQQLLHKSSKTANMKSLRTKISFFIQICDYLRNDDFHRFRKKKLPKRDQIFHKKDKNQNQLETILRYNQPKLIDRSDVVSYNQDDIQNFKNSHVNYADLDIDMTMLRYGLLYLISEQIDRIKAYSFMDLCEVQNPYSLSGKKNFISHQQLLRLYDYFGQKSLILLYNFIKVFGRRIDNVQAIEDKIKQSITLKPDYGFPEFLQLFIEKNKDNPNMLKRINYWKPPHVQILFNYLSPQYQKYTYLQQYATKILSRLRSQQILFYLPQIYQSLTLSSGQIVYNFLLSYARKSASFAHQLIWISKVQSKIQRDPHNKNPRLPGVDQNLKNLQIRSNMLTKDVIRQFTREQKHFFNQVNEFYQQITAVSGKLDPKWPFADKKQRIQEELAKVIVPKSVYLPTNPYFQVVGLKIESGTPMQSAAKCPFLLTFVCKKYCGPDKDFEQRKQRNLKNKNQQDQINLQPIQQQQIPHNVPINFGPIVGSVIGKNSQRKSLVSEQLNRSQCLDISDIRFQIQSRRQNNHKTKSSFINSSFSQEAKQDFEISCIFKVHDDIRQDSLALQVIQLFMEIFQRHNLELKLFPYKTISNRTGEDFDIGGIIEVVPKTVSRDSIGKTNQQSLYQFFLNNFGQQHNSAFQQARQNFIKSQAAYSIISYILQIKDRHNGNILINKQQGYLVHIDFGFIFDISPANNLRFERADFKLTQEMIKIMGGKIQSQPFKLYMSLVIKGFLIARKYYEHIINIVKLMYNSGLPCFLEKSIQNLESRFVLEKSEIEAAQYMKNIIKKAADHWTTNWYDKIQWIQQRIYH